jgi:hypothetical protein
MESSGMWYNIYECLRKRHLDVRLSNPAKTRAIASAKIKTDKLDSIKLADLLRGGYIAECYVPTKETFIAMTVSWLLIRIALTIFSEISFDRFTNSSAYCGVTIGKFMV